MKVVLWGKRLAVRLPANLVKALELKQGDDVDVRVVKRGKSEAADLDRKQLIEHLRAFRGRLPGDWRFDRDEANAR